LIGPAKVIDVAIPALGIVTMSAGILLLPLFNTLGKIVTEVYGHANNCRLIWTGFAAMAFAALFSLYMVEVAPAAITMSNDYQRHLEAIFGDTPRVVLASLLAFLCGSFINSAAMSKLKTVMQERHLLMRAYAATLCSQLVDSCLFYTIAFYGIWPRNQLLQIIAVQCVMKIGCEIIMSPATCAIVDMLKKKETGTPSLAINTGSLLSAH
jgi:uncharacterized integral membrane protein (TIGR00697 family)